MNSPTILRASIATFLILLFPPSVRTQTCGVSYSIMLVSDSRGKSVENVTIEFVCEVTSDEYDKRFQDNSVIKIESGWGTAFKISEQDAAQIFKRAGIMNISQDYCRNPLKRYTEKTKVKLSDAWTSNFRFCSFETDGHEFLMKISAPGYATDYYIGPFLTGCGSIYKLTLFRRPNKESASSKSSHQDLSHSSGAGTNKTRGIENRLMPRWTNCILPISMAADSPNKS